MPVPYEGIDSPVGTGHPVGTDQPARVRELPPRAAAQERARLLSRIAPSAYRPSWLCPTPTDRVRILEMESRGERAHQVIHVALPLSVIVTALLISPWALVLLLPGFAFAALPVMLPRVEKPEWLVLAALLTFVACLGTGISLTGGATSPLILWITFYTVGVASRFAGRAMVVVVLLGLCSGIVAILAHGGTGLRQELATIAVLATVCAVVVRYTQVIVDAEHDYRSAARLDPLTGLLNRSGLEGRVQELRHQCIRNDEPLAFVLCDLDHFKRINDEHGHDRGDAVLRDVATILHTGMRRFELIYRLGGEEFLLVLPGAAHPEATRIAEQIRHDLADARPAGLPVTASFGVSAAHAHDVDFHHLYLAADRALYSAKRNGRNQVHAAG